MLLDAIFSPESSSFFFFTQGGRSWGKKKYFGIGGSLPNPQLVITCVSVYVMPLMGESVAFPVCYQLLLNCIMELWI